MDLFNDAFDPTFNLLPADGEVYYHGQVLSSTQADAYFELLHQDLAWQADQVRIAGKTIHTARQIAWYGDAPFAYTYSGSTKIALPWVAPLLELKQYVEQHTGETFNACLANLYAHGGQGMAWHSDDESMLSPCIASLSFGAQRMFAFKHKTTAESIRLELAHGSLLLMKGQTQRHWLHRLPPTTQVHQTRINLTFRTIVS